MELSTRQLAIALDYSPVYICDIEKGRKPVPDGILEPFPQILHLTKSETDEMYDLTAKSRNTLSFGAFVNLSINCQKLLSSDNEKKGEKRKNGVPSLKNQAEPPLSRIPYGFLLRHLQKMVFRILLQKNRMNTKKKGLTSFLSTLPV